jgi:hypothetical protein
VTTPRRSPWEAILSVVAVGLIAFLPVNAFLASFCLDPSGCDVHTTFVWGYRSAALALVLAVLGTLVLAVRRGATFAVVWHALVGLVGLAAALVFAVPAFSLDDTRSPDPQPSDPSPVPCYSGSADCPYG